MCKARKTFEKVIAFEAKRSPKMFWLHAQSKLKTKTGMAPLLDNPKDSVSLRFDDKSMADLLQKQFLSVNKFRTPFVSTEEYTLTIGSPRMSVYTKEPSDSLPE